jgi:HAE1 family hydrophobic/amphiphilic exporter-1
LVVFSFWKIRALKETIFWKTILGFESLLTRFTNWITEILEWCLNHYIKTILVVVVLFFSSTVGLVGGGFIGGEFFAASDSGEFLVQIVTKDASLELTL